MNEIDTIVLRAQIRQYSMWVHLSREDAERMLDEIETLRRRVQALERRGVRKAVTRKNERR